jgi:hypothetical protein
MRSLLYTFLFFLLSSVQAFSQQTSWPKTITTGSGSEIKIFEIQPQSLNGNNLDMQAAISLKEQSAAEPVFGMIWANAVIEKDQYNNVSRFSKIDVSKLKVPGVTSNDDVEELISIIEEELPHFSMNIAVSELTAQVARNQRQSQLAAGLNTNPPKIIFSKTSSILVFIDGEPQVQKNAVWGVDQVVNTPFTIVRNSDQRFYLYGNKKWYSTTSIHGNWSYVRQLPQNLSAIDEEVRKADTSEITDNAIPNVIVSTVPAELIQSKGEPNFAPVQGTNLLYMTNTNNDIFHNINTQHYYVLISGRWYKAPNLNSSWSYIPSNDLPGDFAKIPEGSAKDAVLASIAGTPAAEESVLDAQLPQTAKVDRNSATASVDYDGEPQFEQIEGTDMEYAVNTPGAVIKDGRRYYYVENGVWFESNNANGPWKVATERPDEVANIPPSSPVYNVKYVYIYDATPEYVYMGYTPGYLGTYVYGPTIVYGTGYHYRPWRGRYYYARPLTWGFNMRYNPWSGWNIGFGFGSGWFYSEIRDYNYFGYPVRRSYASCYGWWGPSVYRPQYSRRHGNYYGGNVIINNNYIVSNNRYNNVYRSRRDVVTYDRSVNENYSRRQRAGYAQNNNRSDEYNNGNVNRRRFDGTARDASGNNNSNGIQRPRRFNGVQQRGSSNGNVGENRNNNGNNSQPGNRLPGSRTGRPQQEDAAGNNGNRNDNNNRGRFGTERPSDIRRVITERETANGNAEAGTPSGRNRDNLPGRNTPSNSNDNSNGNRPAREYNPQRRIGQQPQGDDANNGNRNAGANREVTRPDFGRQQEVENPSRSSRGAEVTREIRRPEISRQQPAEDANRGARDAGVNREIRRPEINRQQEQPARIYAPQRSNESPAINGGAVQRQVERRSAPSAEGNSGNGGGINRRLRN